MTTAVNPSNQHLVLQLTDGTLLDYGPGESHSLRAWTDSSGREICLPQPCVSMAVCQMAGEVRSAESRGLHCKVLITLSSVQDAVLGLTDRFRFFANDLEVMMMMMMDDCSSWLSLMFTCLVCLSGGQQLHLVCSSCRLLAPHDP